MAKLWTYYAVSPSSDALSLRGMPDYHVWWRLNGTAWQLVVDPGALLPEIEYAVIARGDSALTTPPLTGAELYSKKDPPPPPPPPLTGGESTSAFVARMRATEITERPLAQPARRMPNTGQMWTYYVVSPSSAAEPFRRLPDVRVWALDGTAWQLIDANHRLPETDYAIIARSDTASTMAATGTELYSKKDPPPPPPPPLTGGESVSAYIDRMRTTEITERPLGQPPRKPQG